MPMNRLQMLESERARIDVAIAEERQRMAEKGELTGSHAASSSPIFNAMTQAQQRHCEFMGYDPDNPDVPLD